MPIRYCLIDGKEINGLPVQVFVMIDDGDKRKGFKPVHEFMCVDHGANGHNGITKDTYEKLMANRLKELL